MVEPTPAIRRAEEPTGLHVVPLWVYLATYFSLLVLTGATVGAAFLDLGVFNDVVALGIAAAKATLVGLLFMHLKWATRLVPLAAVAGLFWLALLIAGAFGDYVMRGALGIPGK